ncbi:MAG: hypothetical protein V5A27_09900 [Halapricum sp.]
MPTTQQLRAHGDRNEVPDDVSPGSAEASVTDADTENLSAGGSAEPPINEFTLPHMRAVSSDS